MTLSLLSSSIFTLQIIIKPFPNLFIGSALQEENRIDCRAPFLSTDSSQIHAEAKNNKDENF